MKGDQALNLAELVLLQGGGCLFRGNVSLAIPGDIVISKVTGYSGFIHVSILLDFKTRIFYHCDRLGGVGHCRMDPNAEVLILRLGDHGW